MVTHIQIGDISPRIQYTGDGVQTIFTYPFPVFTDVDMEVYEDAVPKVLSTDYTVSGAGNSNGGTVTFITAPASGGVVTIRRNIVIKRTSDFQVAGEFRAEIINDELDYQTAALQQVETNIVRSLRLGPTDSGATILPDKTARSGKYLGFDINGDPIATNAAGPIGPQGPAGNMSGVNNLSEVTAPPTARANLGLVIGTDVIAPNGDGSALTGIVKGATAVEKSNIMLNAFRIEVNGGLAVQNMVAGVADVFVDQTGIDTVGSTNLTYDAVNHLYANGGVLSITQQFTSGTNAQAADSTVAQSFKVSNTEVIIKARWYAYGDMSATTFKWTIETDNANTPSSIVVNAAMGVTQAGPSAAGWQDIVFPGSWTPTTATRYWLTARNSAGGNVPANMWQSDQITGSYANGDMYAPSTTGLGLPPNGGDFLFGVYQQSAPLNMTLISTANTALSTPTSTFIVIEEEDVDAVALNTDLKAYASRDGGTTWTQITLAVAASLTTGRIIIGSADISAQPAGTSMKYKIETLNAKSLKIHSVALQWS